MKGREEATEGGTCSGGLRETGTEGRARWGRRDDVSKYQASFQSKRFVTSLLSHLPRPAGIAVDLRFVVVAALLFVVVFGGARGSASLFPCCSFRFLLYSRQKGSPRRDTRTRRGRKREGRSQGDTLDLSLHPTAPGENEVPFLREIGR